MPPACFSPARSPRNADKSQLPSQRLLGRQTPGGVTPAASGTGAARGPVESPSPLHSQGLCSSFPEWLLDEVMRLRAREEAAGKRCWPGPSSPGTRLPGLRALPAQRLPRRGPRGLAGSRTLGRTLAAPLWGTGGPQTSVDWSAALALAGPWAQPRPAVSR